MDVEDEGQVRQRPPDRDVFERIEQVVVDAPGRALIRPRRVDETIAEYPIAIGERRPDDAIDMVGTRRGKKESLRLRAKLPDMTFEKYLADTFGKRRAAR